MLFKKGWKKKNKQSAPWPLWLAWSLASHPAESPGAVMVMVMYIWPLCIGMIVESEWFIIDWHTSSSGYSIVCLEKGQKTKKNAKGLQGTEEAHAPEEKEEKQVSFRPSSLHSSLLANNCQWANQPKSLAEKCSSPRYGERLYVTAFLRQMH